MTRKVLIHPSPFEGKKAWDVFSNNLNDTLESLGLYYIKDCSYAVEFKKKHPELSYVGSEDDNHIYLNRPPDEVE